eukprot:5138612-Amphidinium_carterae.3
MSCVRTSIPRAAFAQECADSACHTNLPLLCSEVSTSKQSTKVFEHTDMVCEGWVLFDLICGT